MICVVAPLSSNPTCPPTPDQPAFSGHFFQYSLKVDSLNSLVLITSTYDGTTPDEFKLAPTGWSAWLRPAAQKVFLDIDGLQLDADDLRRFRRQVARALARKLLHQHRK